MKAGSYSIDYKFIIDNSCTFIKISKAYAYQSVQ